MTRLGVAAASVAAFVVLGAAAEAAAAPAPGFTELVSASSAGVQGNQDSERPAISADGRFVAFASFSDNLVPGDTNGTTDIFVRDRVTGTTERVSVSSAGRQADGPSGLINGMAGPSISADGRYVAFDSEATNLVRGDTNSADDVFVRDRLLGTTERVSVATGGAQAGGVNGAISDDGTRVAFSSSADNLVPGDTNFAEDVFVHDRVSGATVRVSTATDGTQGDNQSFEPSLDGNGHVVAFTSAASNLVANDNDGTFDVFVHDLDTGVTEPISVSPDSGVTNHGGQPNISANGRFVVFDTQARDLFPDANGPVQDVVLFDRTTHSYQVESVNDAGQQGNDNSSNPFVSDDGRYVAFTSFASNLVGDDTNFRDDVFVHDRQLGITYRVSVGSNGQQGDLDSIASAIDADGQVVAFWSDSATLVPESGQSFFAYDAFVRDARPAANLALTLADSPDPATVRGDLTYAATISNNGPAAATGVTLVADLPADATFVSASGAACTRGGKGKTDGTLTCSVGSLAAGASTSVTILVQPSRAGTLIVMAKAFADQPDPNRGDNSATATTTVTR